MRVLLLILAILMVTAVPVSAMEFNPPTAPPEAQELMPVEKESFGEGLWEIIKNALADFAPQVSSAIRSCTAMIAVVMLSSILNGFPGNSKKAIRLVTTLALGAIFIGQANTMIHLCADTVRSLSDYGKLLLPVMTASLAAQGGVTSATALYAGTTVFDTLLSTAVSKLLVPLAYLFLALAVANCATGEELLKKFRDFVKWLMTWGLKTVLYIFTGYLSITGVITGTTDAAALKATKLTISGVVPVVGGILSDASEAVLVSAGVMKNAVGVYGLLVVLAVWITPFLQIGVQYLLLKMTGAVCGVFGVKNASDLIDDFSGVMGLLLGMTGTVCFLLLVSTICFMKGMG